MLKKTISLLLTLIIAFCMAVSAYAEADTITLNEEQAKSAVEAGVAALIAEDGEDVDVDKDLVDEIIADSKTPEAISKSISNFVFIEKSQVGQLSDAIVNDSKYTVKITADGKETVYVAVSIIDHPEIFDARVFINVAKKLTKKSDEFAQAKGIDVTSGNYDPLSYNHIAGELALHMIIYSLTDAVGGNNWTGLIKDLYDRSAVSDLNVDENRIPTFLIEFFGGFLTFLLGIFLD